MARARGDYADANALLVGSLSLRAAVGDKIGIAACLRGLATIAALTHRDEQAALLFGAAEALREAIGATVARRHTRYD